MSDEFLKYYADEAAAWRKRAEAAEARVAELEARIESGRAAHLEERVARDWLARENATLRAIADAAEAYVTAIDSAVNNPADFLGSIEREQRALENVRAALAARGKGEP